MEPNNNSTTVGGVTFGGGTAPTSDNPAPAPAPVEPAAPAEPAPAPAEPVPAEEPVTEGYTKIEDAEPVVPVQTTLSVPFVSPTSFDNATTVRPVVKDPSIPEVVEPAKEKKDKKEETPEQAVKKVSTLTIAFGILMFVFLVVGIVGFVLAMNKDQEISKLKDQVEDKTNLLQAVAEAAGVPSIEKIEDVPVYKATTGYIYISEWGIKIKVPDSLEKVSYILNQNYRPSICFNAVGKGVQYFPDFANIGLNPGRMGCLTRIHNNEGSFDATSGLSFGELVFTSKDYNYFYNAPIDYSVDAANLGLEHTAQTLIKSMLTDNVEVYE